MNLILLTFGQRLENHYQACFAILSFLKDPLIKRVVVITDRAEFYTFLGDKVSIFPINDQILKEWQGEYQFFWRIKIKALEKIAQIYPEQDLLYIDSDTFLATDLQGIQQKLASQQAIMHLNETHLGSGSTKRLRNMCRVLNGKTLSGVSINEQSQMWNAGVIGLPAKQASQLIALSLQLCDEICATTCPRYLIEQFAFSLALNHLNQLSSCEQSIGHYWGNKTEWNQLICQFFVKTQLTQTSLQDCIEQLAHFNWQQIPLSKKQRKTNQTLKKYIDNLFPAKHIRYF